MPRPPTRSPVAFSRIDLALACHLRPLPYEVRGLFLLHVYRCLPLAPPLRPTTPPQGAPTLSVQYPRRWRLTQHALRDRPFVSVVRRVLEDPEALEYFVHLRDKVVGWERKQIMAWLVASEGLTIPAP